MTRKIIVSKEEKLEDKTTESLKEMYKEIFVNDVIKTISESTEELQIEIAKITYIMQNSIQPLLVNSKITLENKLTDEYDLIEENTKLIEYQQISVNNIIEEIQNHKIKFDDLLSNIDDSNELIGKEIRAIKHVIINNVANKEQVEGIDENHRMFFDQIIGESINKQYQLEQISKQLNQIDIYNSNHLDDMTELTKRLHDNEKFLRTFENDAFGKQELMQRELKQFKKWMIFIQTSVMIGIIILGFLLIMK